VFVRIVEPFISPLGVAVATERVAVEKRGEPFELSFEHGYQRSGGKCVVPNIEYWRYKK